MSRVARITLVVCALATAAHAQDTEFVLSMGYAHVELNGDVDSTMESEGGFRFEPRFSWALNDEDDVMVRLGVGSGFSFYREEHDSPGGVFDPDDFEELTLITPELQLSLRGYVADEWFVEGGVGPGPV